MSKVLVITSSALADASASNSLVGDAVSRLREADPDIEVIVRDLGANPIPHLGPDAALALGGGAPANDAQAAARELSDALVAELAGAETIVIGSPMYNFGIASTLKAWFDHVLRAGITFRYTENGPEGLLRGKRAIVIETRGGIYADGPAQTLDAQEPHLRALLRFIGIEDLVFIRAEGLALGPAARSQAIATAQTRVREVFGLDRRSAA